jgi:NTE family protein
LQLGALQQLAWPRNWRFLLSRSNLLARELLTHWGLDVPLSVIPREPEWSINGTTAENGKRFRFKGTQIGDWELGYAEAPDFPLGCALAVSAAFPVGFGPLAIDPAEFVWRKRPWGAAPGADAIVELPYRRLHLYDGGLYDNLGAESFFHPGTQQPKHAGDYIIVADAGAPLATGMTSGPLSPFRIKRMMDIMSDQCRALRIRSFVNYLQKHPTDGAFLPIGMSVSGKNCQKAVFAKSFPTSLKRLGREEFNRLSAYGYEVTVVTEKLYGLC